MNTALPAMLPDLESVDFGNPFETSNWVGVLLGIATELGMTMPGFKPTKESNALRRIANNAVRKFDEILPRLSAAKAFMTIAAYDFAHRLAYHSPADQNIVDRYTLKAFTALINGDEEVNQYAVFRQIQRSIMHHDSALTGQPRMWLGLVLERWYREALTGFDRSRLSDYDIINRVSILLTSDLSAFEGSAQDQFKRRLLSRYCHYLCIAASTPALTALQKAANDFEADS